MRQVEGGFIGQERIRVVDGKVYLIRDVWSAPFTTENVRSGVVKLVRCEYAVAGHEDAYGTIELNWRECEEGVLFKAIQPAFTLEHLNAWDEPAIDLSGPPELSLVPAM